MRRDFLGKALGNKTHRLLVDKNFPMGHLVTEFRQEKAGLEALVIRVQAAFSLSPQLEAVMEKEQTKSP